MADILQIMRRMREQASRYRATSDKLFTREASRAVFEEDSDAIDRVAELVAANEEYDAARIERGRWLLCELNDEGLAALVRWHNAIERRAAALAAMKG